MGKKHKKTKNRPRKRGLSWLGGAAAALIGSGAVWAWLGAGTPSRTSGQASTAEGAYVRRESRVALSPALFVGQTARAYQIAHEIPEVLDQLYCYCECDKHLGHRSLLSCFVDSHAAT